MDALFELWQDWLRGAIGSGAELWGLDLIWWGRIGKLLQFAGGVTILSEIIGPQRLREFGGRLHSTFRLEDMKARFKDVRNYRVAMWRYVSSAIGSEEEEKAMVEAQESGFNKLNFAITAIAIVVSIYLIWIQFSLWPFVGLTIVAIMFGSLFAFMVGPIVTQILIYIVMFAGLCIDTFLFEPVAWILERPALDRWIKLFALLLLIIGFHFDLLTDA